MSKRLASFVVSGDAVKVVVAEVPTDKNDPISVDYDQTWSLQSGPREPALHVLHQRCASFLKEQQIKSVVVKASAAPQSKATLSLLHSAEVRGVVIAAAASVASVQSLAKGVISRKYGDRNVDEYLEDEGFWTSKTTGAALRKGSREAAMLIIAAREL
ncbi:hypothetical protein KAK07_09085 [Ideonella sp. 4Y16]|uniref:hypothetical protein n=1 Tax=Ideonella alba TaxID=2824118 RepID=UPI001B377CE2|nr:hypothetical protein [Ideonella alba]MBQ0943489.1 hypothetical protein [Ideonella alba]